jgi:hypothetical protein
VPYTKVLECRPCGMHARECSTRTHDGIGVVKVKFVNKFSVASRTSAEIDRAAIDSYGTREIGDNPWGYLAGGNLENNRK